MAAAPIAALRPQTSGPHPRGPHRRQVGGR